MKHPPVQPSRLAMPGLSPPSQEPSPALVSIVIPNYNSAATLAQAIDSALGQTYANVEVVVVDDGSADASASVLDRYADRVRCIGQSHGGLAKARNTGCLNAAGRYVALLDADDMCEPQRIATQVAFMESHPDVVLCGSEFSLFDEAGVIATRFARRYYSRLASQPNGVPPSLSETCSIDVESARLGFGGDGPRSIAAYAGHAYPELALGNFVHPPTAIFRREVLEMAGPFDEGIPNACDWEWFVRVARTGKVGFIDWPLLRYRRSGGQMSGASRRLEMYLDVIANLRRFERNDPRLRQALGKAYGFAIGHANIDAAGALLEIDKMAALAMLLVAARHLVLDAAWLRYFAKVVLPRSVVRWIVSHRQA